MTFHDISRHSRANVYVIKPFSLEEVVARLQALLRHSRTSADEIPVMLIEEAVPAEK